MTPDPFLKQLLSLPVVSYARLSPDRHWLAFTWPGKHASVDVFIVPSDGSALPVALTHTPELTRLVDWSPDSRSVLVAEDHDGDERLRLFQVEIGAPGSLQSRPMLPLTEDRPLYFLRGGDLAPDGATLYYGANFDFARGCAIAPTWIYRHDLQSGARTPIAQPRQPAYTLPELNLAGTHLIYARKDRSPAGRQYYLVDAQGREDREILNFGDDVKVSARWFPDSEYILVLSEASGSGNQQHISLGVYHWPSRAMRWLIDDPRRSIENAWVSPDGLVIVDELRSTVHSPFCLDPASGVIKPFPALPGNLLPLGRLADGDWVSLYYSAAQPADLVRLAPGAETSAGLFSLTRGEKYSPFSSPQLVPAEAFHWPSKDGLAVHGWLYRAHPNLHRAILRLHGGPSSHAEDRVNPQIQYLVAHGFNVLDVNYRGSTGFGLAYREAIKADGWGGREQEDIAAAAMALIDRGFAEPGRVGVTGTSYGGYSAWHLVTHYPPAVIAAAAPICGMTDLVLDYETTRPDLRPLSEEMMGGSPEQVPERYAERSPINYVHNIRGKLLIVQGARDPNVTPEHVHHVVQYLEAQKIPYELLVFEDEGHGIEKPANQEILYPRLAAFFDAALG